MVQATFNETLPGAKAGMDPKEANKAEQERLALNEQLKAEGKPQIPGTSLASGTTSKNPSDYATSGGPGGQGNKPVENPTF